MDLYYHPASLHGKKESGYLPETRVVVEAFIKQPHFCVCIKIEREGKIFRKVRTKERIM